MLLHGFFSEYKPNYKIQYDFSKHVTFSNTIAAVNWHSHVKKKNILVHALDLDKINSCSVTFLKEKTKGCILVDVKHNNTGNDRTNAQ